MIAAKRAKDESDAVLHAFADEIEAMTLTLEDAFLDIEARNEKERET